MRAQLLIAGGIIAAFVVGQRLGWWSPRPSSTTAELGAPSSSGPGRPSLPSGAMAFTSSTSLSNELVPGNDGVWHQLAGPYAGNPVVSGGTGMVG
jgi:hypothetical protein